MSDLTADERFSDMSERELLLCARAHVDRIAALARENAELRESKNAFKSEIAELERDIDKLKEERNQLQLANIGLAQNHSHEPLRVRIQERIDSLDWQASQADAEGHDDFVKRAEVLMTELKSLLKDNHSETKKTLDFSEYHPMAIEKQKVELCPHGLPLAGNICVPCSKGRSNSCSSLCHPNEPCMLTENGECQQLNTGDRRE